MAIRTATVIPFVESVYFGSDYDQPKYLDFVLLGPGAGISTSVSLCHAVDINTTEIHIVATLGLTRVYPAEHPHNTQQLDGQLLIYIDDDPERPQGMLKTLSEGMRYMFFEMLYPIRNDRVGFFLHHAKGYPMLVAWIAEIAARCAPQGDLGQLKADAKGYETEVTRALRDALSIRQANFRSAIRTVEEEIPARAELIQRAHKSG